MQSFVKKKKNMYTYVIKFKKGRILTNKCEYKWEITVNGKTAENIYKI